MNTTLRGMAIFGMALAGSGLLATQNAWAQAPNSMATPPDASSGSPDDQNVKSQVVAALAAEKFANASHVEVSMKDGKVVLHGFVLSNWDRRHAIEAAKKAAPGRTVLDDIHMKEGQAR